MKVENFRIGGHGGGVSSCRFDAGVGLESVRLGKAGPLDAFDRFDGFICWYEQARSVLFLPF